MSKRERVYIVDENDTVIGEKWWDEVVRTDRIRIAGVWLENSFGELLIAQRAMSMDYDPGLWGPTAAGSLTVDESYEDTAKKELLEEVGLDVDSESIPITLSHKMPYGNKDTGLKMLAVFIVKIDRNIDEFKIDHSEVKQLRWMSKEKLSVDIRKNPHLYVSHPDAWASRVLFT